MATIEDGYCFPQPPAKPEREAAFAASGSSDSCAPAPCSARSSDNKIGYFRKELERLLNRMSMENRSDTPNFILAQYMTDCLEAHDRAVNRREVWYGRKTGEPEQVPND